jgi:hypothetical protein
VAGELSAPIAFLGDDGKPFADGATGRLWVDDEDLNHVDVVEGVAPSAAGEIAVDRGLAEDEDLAVGDRSWCSPRRASSTPPSRASRRSGAPTPSIRTAPSRCRRCRRSSG